MVVLKSLAFCTCGYVWLGVMFGYYMGTAQAEGIPFSLIAHGAYACLLTICCLLSLFSNFWPAIVSWLGVLAYFTISWKVDAIWVFRAQLIPCLCTPVLLALVAHVARRENT